MRLSVSIAEHRKAGTAPGGSELARGPSVRPPGEALLALHHRMGNRAVERLIQAKLDFSSPDDEHERWVDRVADRVMSVPHPASLDWHTRDDANVCGAKEVCGGPCERRAGVRFRSANQAIPWTAPPIVHEVLRSPSQPLDPATRAFMESRLGHDFSRVRVHTDTKAAESARVANARAYAVGSDIAFASGEYRSHSREGRRLIAHELVHTMRQADGRRCPASVIQRQEAGRGGKITARSIFPYEQGERVTVNHLVNEDMLRLIGRMNRDLATLIRHMVERRARVTVATDEIFEALIEPEPATERQPARRALVMRLRKSGGQFDLEFFEVDDEGRRVSLQPLPGLTARREGSTITLSGRIDGFNLEFAVRPGETPGHLTLGVSSPMSLQLLDIRALRTTRAGSTEERQTVERAARETRGARRVSRQRLSVEAGSLGLAEEPVAPLLGLAWQMNFPLSERLGPLAELPLEVQLQYAPEGDFLARVSSGVETSLAPIVPVNARLVVGAGAGSIHPEPTRAIPERRLLLGPTVGGGVGLEQGWFRMDVRYEYLISLLERSPNAHSLVLRLGGAF